MIGFVVIAIKIIKRNGKDMSRELLGARFQSTISNSSNEEISVKTLGAIHKLRLQEEVGRWSKQSTFCKLLYHRKCKWRGVGGQIKPNLVNVVCERPLEWMKGRHKPRAGKKRS